MRTEQAAVIRLEDYLVPDYLIDETHLAFYLNKEATTVQAKLHIRHNPKAGEGLPVLALNGEQLELLEIKLDGQLLSKHDYQIDEQYLRLQPRQADFILETRVRIYPHNNAALEGLYQSAAGKMYCTQCEAEGFRKITYYLDRPDVMSRFTVHISADKARYPILLSNGNLIDSGQSEESGEHFALWYDPFPKPCYLFALVAGDLSCAKDNFITQSGREVALHIYVEQQHIDQVGHAMISLKKAMRFLADCVLQLDRLNPQTAARLLTPLTRFRKYDEKRQALMQAELTRLQQEPLSKDVFELASKSLA